MTDQALPPSLPPAMTTPERPLQPSDLAVALGMTIVMLLVGATGMLGFRIGADQGVQGLPEEFTNVELLFDAVADDAVSAPGAEELIDGAIGGVLGALDDNYAIYYDPDRYEALNADLDGEFVGIGVTIEERSDGVYVVGVLPGSPAEAVGVIVGERITSVEGQSALDGATSRDVIDLIAGDEGEPVTVGFDQGPDGPRELTMVRAVLDLPEVASRVLDSGYGYAAAKTFSRNVNEQLAERVAAMVAEDDIDGLILDLRGNPGGLLTEAVEVVSLFVEEGVVVRVESRAEEVDRRVLGNAEFPDLPLVVLVDHNSASASEIVAGALQDLDRAQVVGLQTFGKGTVQTIRDLDLGAGVKFTTARYFTPSGDSIEGVGVTPDVITSEDIDDQLAAAETALAQQIAEGPGF